MQGDEGFSVVEEIQQDTMQNKKIDKLPLFEKVLGGACIAAFGAFMVSESVFTMSILSVTVLAIVALFQEVRK